MVWSEEARRAAEDLIARWLRKAQTLRERAEATARLAESVGRAQELEGCAAELAARLPARAAR